MKNSVGKGVFEGYPGQNSLEISARLSNCLPTENVNYYALCKEGLT